jgi:hypothetical protein
MIETTSRNPYPAALPRRRLGSTRRRAWLPAAGAATVAMTVGACSTWSLTGSAPPAADTASTTATAPADGSFTSRVKSLFSGNSASLNSAGDVNCPPVEYRLGAATWAVNGPAAENSAMSLRYQASFTQTARECLVSDSNLTIKVGVQGRIVIGPAGSPGTISIPLRYALVREDLHPRTLWTRLFTVPVTVPADELNVAWLHVQEEMTVPRPSPQELDAYVVYVGFDPEGAGKAAAPRPKTARAK